MSSELDSRIDDLIVKRGSLDVELRAAIREARAVKVPMSTIANRLGVSRQTAYNLING